MTQDTSAARRRLGLVALCVGTFMLLLDLTVINVALPPIQEELGASFSDLQWMIDAYALGLAAFLLAAGAVGDRVGRRRVFLAGVVLFMATSALCALATSPGMLVVARGLQGLGGAIMLASAPALIAQEFSGRERNTAFAAFGGVTGLAVASGPVIGGALTEVDWPYIFWLNIPLGGLAFVLAWVGLRDRPVRSATGRLGWVSALVLCPGLFLVVLGLTEASHSGWTSREVLGSFAVGGVLLVVVVLMQRNLAVRIFDAGLLRARTFLGLGLATLLVFAGVFPVLLFSVLYLQRLQGYSALETGVRLLPMTLALFFASSAAGAVLLGRVPRRVLASGALAVTAVGLGLLVLLDTGSSWTALLPGMVVAGLGVGVFNPVRAESTVALVDERDSGMASGLGSTFQEVGVAVGVALFGTLFSSAFAGALTDRGLPEMNDLGASAQALDAARDNPNPVVAQMFGLVEESFLEAWDGLALGTALACAIGAVLAWCLMREKDFEVHAESHRAAGAAVVA